MKFKKDNLYRHECVCASTDMYVINNAYQCSEYEKLTVRLVGKNDRHVVPSSNIDGSFKVKIKKEDYGRWRKLDE